MAVIMMMMLPFIKHLFCVGLCARYEETETYTGQGTCPKPQNLQVTDQDWNAGLLGTCGPMFNLWAILQIWAHAARGILL